MRSSEKSIGWKVGDPPPWQVDDFWTMEICSPEKGAIRDMFALETVNDHILVACGSDGGIFTFRFGKTLDDAYFKVGIF